MQYLTIEIKLGTIYQDQKHLEIIKVFFGYRLSSNCRMERNIFSRNVEKHILLHFPILNREPF